MAEKSGKSPEQDKIAATKKRNRMILIAILAVAVIIALVFILFRTVLGPTAPGAPSNLVATVISYSQIDLSWQDNSNNETGFKIERKIGAQGTYQQIVTVGADVIKYSDTGLS